MSSGASGGTVHGCFIPVPNNGVVSAIHVLDGGVVAMARCFVHARATCVVGVLDVTMCPAITAAGRSGFCGGSVGDSGVGEFAVFTVKAQMGIDEGDELPCNVFILARTAKSMSDWRVPIIGCSNGMMIELRSPLLKRRPSVKDVFLRRFRIPQP